MRSLESFGAVADGHMGSPSDNAPAFQEAALWASENGGSVYVKSHGRFGISGNIRMPSVTFLMNDSTIVPFGTAPAHGLRFSGRQSKAIAIASDAEEGSKEIELADATGIEKGAWLSLQSKPNTLPMRFTMMAQAVKVEGKWVELSLPLSFPMRRSDREAIVVPSHLLEGGGLRDCTFDFSAYQGPLVRGVQALWTRNQLFENVRFVRKNDRPRDSFSEAGMTMWGGYGNTAIVEFDGVGTAGLYDFSFQQQTMGDVVAISRGCPSSPDLVSQGSYNRARLESYGAFGRGIRVFSERHSSFPATVCEDAGMTGLSLAYGTAHCGFNGFRLHRNGGPGEAGLWLNGQGGIDYNQFTNGVSLDSTGPADIEIRGRGNLVQRCQRRISDSGTGTIIVP